MSRSDWTTPDLSAAIRHAPTGAPTNATDAPTPSIVRRRLEATVPLPVSKSFHRSGGAHTEARRRLQALSS